MGGTEMEHFDGEVMLPATVGEVAGKRYETDGLIRVLFDSFSHPALAGTRSAAMSPMGLREIIFQAEPYQIDIQFEAQAEHNRLVVTGQLLDVSHPEKVGRDVPILFSVPRGTVVQTVTNQFGEFRVELENSLDLELSLIVPRGKPIVILLRGALKPSSGARQ